MITKHRLIFSFIIGILLPYSGLQAQPLPPNSLVRSIYFDTQESKETSKNYVRGAAPDHISDWLTAHGYEVINFEGDLPDAAEIVLTYDLQWDMDKKGPFIKSFSARLDTRKKKHLGRVTLNEPTTSDSAKRPSDTYDIINRCLLDLFSQCHPTKRDLARDPNPDKPQPHASTFLKPMDIYELSAVTKTLENMQYPIPEQKLVEALGGKGRLVRQMEVTKTILGRNQTVVEYVASDITARFGYYAVDLWLEPQDDLKKEHLVTKAYIIYRTNAGSFVPAPKELSLF